VQGDLRPGCLFVAFVRSGSGSALVDPVWPARTDGIRCRMYEQSVRHWGIWLTGLAALLVAVMLIGVLVTSLLDRGDSQASPSPADAAPSITSERAAATVKEWIAGGTEVMYVHDLLADLVCNGYYQGGSTWEVMCRLPWIPVEGYFFTLSEVSGEVEPETEATLTFVRLLRQWGQVPEP
jgi:hypothetical protein